MHPATPPAARLSEHVEFVRALARAALRGDAECEDVAQEVLAAALEGPVRSPEHQRSWYARTVHHRVLDLLRGRARRRAREQAAAQPEALAAAADLVEQAETGRRLVGAVLALDEPQRTSVLLRYYEGLAPRQIAARLSLPVETVRTRLKRALALLRTRLEAQEGGRGRSWSAALAPLAAGGASGAGAPLALQAGLLGGLAGALGGGLGGGLAMKQVAVAALLLVLALGTGAYLVLDGGGREERGAAPEQSLAAGTVDGANRPFTGPDLRGAARPAESPPASDAPGAELSPLVVRGLVVDEEGRPLEGVEVREAPPWSGAVLEVDAPPAPGLAWPGAVSDAEGRFTLTGPPGQRRSSVIVKVLRAGLLARSSLWNRVVELRCDGAEQRVVMVRAARIQVRVRTAGGASPVAGARVQAFEARGYQFHTATAEDEAQTDAEGLAELTLAGGAHAVVVTAAGWAQAVVPEVRAELASATEPAAAVPVELRAGGTLTGVVTGPGGGPAAGAVLHLLRYPAQQLRATADAEGRYRFEHVNDEDVRLGSVLATRIVVIACDAPGLPRQWASTVPPPAGGSATFDLALGPRRDVRLEVLRADGAPAAGVLLSLRSEEGQPLWGWTTSRSLDGGPWKTDAAGRLVVQGIGPGTLLIWQGERETGEPLLRHAVAREPELEPVMLRLPSATSGERRVRVVDAQGRPIGGASVRAVEDTGPSHESAMYTDADGCARLISRKGGALRLAVDAPGAGPVVLLVPEASPLADEVLVRLGSGRLTGRVRRLSGSPVGLTLVLEQSVRLERYVTSVAGWNGRVTSDADGRFLFEQVAEAPHSVRAADRAWRVLTPPREARPGAADLELVVVDENEAVALTPRVEIVDAATGRPPATPPRAVLRDAAGQDVLGLYGNLEQPGRLEVHELAPPGAYTLRITCPGYEPTEVSVTVSASGPAVAPRVELRAAR